VFYLLSVGNYVIELTYEEGPSYYSEIPFGFLYKDQFVESRDKLNAIQAHETDAPRVSRQEIAKDIARISGKLNSIYESGVIDYLELSSWYTTQLGLREIDLGITMRVNEVQVLSLWTVEHDPAIEHGETDIDAILSMLGLGGEVVDLSKQPWFAKLNGELQQLVLSGTNMIHKIGLRENRDSLLDYSSLLLPFVKAVESETSQHFQSYLNDIVSISKTLVPRLQKMQKIQDLEPEAGQLLRIANAVLRKKNGYRPSGTSALYYLLKYYALGEASRFVDDLQGYLGPSHKRLLRKNTRVINRCKEAGEFRNEFIHHEIISGESEFTLLYNDIAVALKLLADLKQ